MAFQRFPGGQIGAGVGKEIFRADEDGSPVYEITDGEVLAVEDVLLVEPDVLTVEATIRLLDELRA